jgi:tRNA threonylcarbamoyladenosine biosynthesis protein TsaB
MKKKEKSLTEKVLFINTVGDISRIAIFVDAKKFISKQWSGKQELSEKLLFKTDSLLSKAKISVNNLTSISVCRGPGSYTGLRVGLTVANFLAWSLGIPIYSANKFGKIIGTAKKNVLPKYYSSPMITKPKIK